ncbi:MAG: glycosyltransferase family 2 protein [Candidatus Omnitrophica bacterium]|nr:glycosyltransferase family 2 protein [Candidatus Omnitrophota bacterium]
MKTLVAPIAFNEEVKLRSVVERFCKSPLYGQADYLVMDDGSTDGTQKMLQGFAARGVRTLRHNFQSGVGAAIRTVIKYARANNYEVLVIMAGNDKDDPNELPVLLKEIANGFEFVQGSRYKGRVGVGGDMPFYRKLATRMHPWLMSLFLGVRITDSTNGYRAIRLSLFDDARINIDQRWLDAYELEPYLMFKAIQFKHKFTEVFVTKIYPPKKLGYTKMKPFFGWWSILKPVFYLGLGMRK